MAMVLRRSLGLGGEATAVERSVEGVLAEGYRTADSSGDGGDVVKTAEMGDVIAGGAWVVRDGRHDRGEEVATRYRVVADRLRS